MKKHGIMRKYIVKLVRMRKPIHCKKPTEKVSGFFELALKGTAFMYVFTVNVLNPNF